MVVTKKTLDGSVGLTGVVRRATITIDGRTYQANTITSTGFTFESDVYLDRGDHNFELQISLANS
jgi:hypothetical protein